MNIAYDAMMFAREAHKYQVRKYTGNPYVEHLAEVAGIAGTIQHIGMPLTCVMAVAWLHDCMEDQGVSEDTLLHTFGADIALGVVLLSDMEVGNRAHRTTCSRERLAIAPNWVQSIKCADIISNSQSIVLHDPKFAFSTYLREKEQLLDVMVKADPRLLALARLHVHVGGNT